MLELARWEVCRVPPGGQPLPGERTTATWQTGYTLPGRFQMGSLIKHPPGDALLMGGGTRPYLWGDGLFSSPDKAKCMEGLEINTTATEAVHREFMQLLRLGPEPRP